ncbi:hypothetical protein HJC23_003263 [Cyclotella cryptica]|uniref:Uncharacterized protein n=1 Tax=Cyclotella cryptica TaxID=29204 RepID=A0ABD3R884_9STRA
MPDEIPLRQLPSTHYSSLFSGLAVKRQPRDITTNTKNTRRVTKGRKKTTGPSSLSFDKHNIPACREQHFYSSALSPARTARVHLYPTPTRIFAWYVVYNFWFDACVHRWFENLV